MKFNLFVVINSLFFTFVSFTVIGKTTLIESYGNPLIADGHSYTADPAPMVFDKQLYLLTGKDMAAVDQNDFIMPNWQLLISQDLSSHQWQHIDPFLKPESLFSWAQPKRAYAAQMVHANNHFYLYAPVVLKEPQYEDNFAIGVAVADSPLGPWKDARDNGPLISQGIKGADDLQNIDPTVWVDEDGSSYLYWGTFGELRAARLSKDMVHLEGAIKKIRGLPGFFEAPWLFKRKNSYYLVYAANTAGPDSPCTPTIYHACLAWASAEEPMGPWHYGGVLLKPVSSTTSHPGIVEFQGQWRLFYHTADAVNGGHFRRSVAMDILQWDDSQSPAAMLPVTPTRTAAAVRPHNPRNLASSASVSASNLAMPHKYWLKAVHDNQFRENPLPPEIWSSEGNADPTQASIVYRFTQAVSIAETRVLFWHNNDVTELPQKWQLQYWDKTGWRDIAIQPGTNSDWQQQTFNPVASRCFRLLLSHKPLAQGYANTAIQEWQLLASATNQAAKLSEPDCPSE